MKISNFVQTFFLVFFLFNGPVQLAAAPLDPQASLEEFVKTLQQMDPSAADSADQKELIKKADSFLDLQAMGERAMEAHWNKMSEPQRNQFMDLLWKLIESVAYPRSHKFLKDLTIRYPESSADADGWRVKSLARQGEDGVDVETVYHLIQKEGMWKINDVALDGVSITEDLQYQFDKIISDSNYDGLLAAMQKRLDDAKSTSESV